MPFVDWLIVLAIALLAVAFFGLRHRACRSLGERTQQFHATRLIVQAIVALWAAPLVFQHAVSSHVGGTARMQIEPRLALGIALLLLIAGAQWLVRGGRRLRQRRMFRSG